MNPRLFNFDCPQCGAINQVTIDASGHTRPCGQCGTIINLPKFPPIPIGGWLAVLGVGMILSWLVELVAVWFVASAMTLSDNGPAPWLIWIGFGGYTALLVFFGWAFFSQFTWFPKAWIAWIWTALGVSTLWLYLLFGDVDAVGLGKGVGAALFWTLYFLGSRRVRETFTR